MSTGTSRIREHGLLAGSIAALFFLIACICIWLFDGTTNIGDSVGHYLYARYAPQHPQLFFNHWAKPLYVLLFTPVAQLGFEAAKVQNLLLSAGSIYLTYMTALRLGLHRPWLAALFVACSPKFFIIGLSGLTEPLFALLLIGSILLLLKEKWTIATTIISFLPFVRSEGLLFIGLVGVLLMTKRQWKVLPLLLVGHLVYGLVGWSIEGDPLWVLTKIPYASATSPYGNGKLFHFLEQLHYIIGLPINVLFWVGVATVIGLLITAKMRLNMTEVAMIWGGIFVFVLFHSIAWYKGMFNSMGLPRVLVGIVPLIALLALRGFHTLVDEVIGMIHHGASRIIGPVLLLYVLLFPVIPNPASIRVDHDLAMRADQWIIHDLHKQLDPPSGRLLYDHPYVSEVFKVDHFDDDRTGQIDRVNIEAMASGELLIWDNWFSVVEQGRTLENLQLDPALELVLENKRKDVRNEAHFVVFRKR